MSKGPKNRNRIICYPASGPLLMERASDLPRWAGGRKALAFLAANCEPASASGAWDEEMAHTIKDSLPHSMLPPADL